MVVRAITMVTEIVIDNKNDLQTGLAVYDLFQERTGIDLEDYLVSKLSKDEKQVLIYTDLDKANLHHLMVVLIQLDYEVISFKKRTPEYADFMGDAQDCEIVKRFATGQTKTTPPVYIHKKPQTKKPAVNWLLNICLN